MFQSIISVLWGQLSIIKEKDQVKSSKKILMITRTKAFCWLLMWLITVSAFNKRSFWLPVFLVLIWLVCRCCTKREKKTQTKQKGKKKTQTNASQVHDPTGPTPHTCWALFFLVPIDQKNSTHSILCQSTQSFQLFGDRLTKLWGSLNPPFFPPCLQRTKKGSEIQINSTLLSSSQKGFIRKMGSGQMRWASYQPRFQNHE